ncbi:MAG: hypothetical protein MJZ58_02130 [Paludibacteraceae bacterium]|nr:hypothetical protein [Paludibacteraceae bacterium]
METDTLGILFKDDYAIGNVHVRQKLWEKRNQKIYHYMQVKYLYDLLESNTLYVNNRALFSDVREQGKLESLKYRFDIFLPHSHNKQEKKENMESCKELSKIKEIAHKSCISCWTMGTNYSNCEEDILEWDHYGTGKAQYGETCRIETTVEDLVNSIKSNKDAMWLSEVQYDKEKMRANPEQWILWKHHAYRQENEIRLCIDTRKDYVRLNINPIELISSIRLSPYIHENDQQRIITDLEKYSFLQNKIFASHILEKHNQF